MIAFFLGSAKICMSMSAFSRTKTVVAVGLPSLKYIGCVDPKGFDKEYYGRFTPAVDSKCGFLSASLLIDARSKSKNVPNFYKDYLDE